MRTTTIAITTVIAKPFCRILSNARCLSEGIDVPALDAVIFYKPRKSHIDVVQAVGRVMRKAPGKQYGYVILPVAIPDDKDPAAALNDNERFSNVWSVLNALRSHDDRFDGQINSIDLNKQLPDSIVIGGGGDSASDWDPEQLSLLPIEIPVEAILSKIVEKCGDKRYWGELGQRMSLIFLTDSLTGFKIYWTTPKMKHSTNGSTISIRI